MSGSLPSTLPFRAEASYSTTYGVPLKMSIYDWERNVIAPGIALLSSKFPPCKAAELAHLRGGRPPAVRTLVVDESSSFYGEA